MEMSPEAMRTGIRARLSTDMVDKCTRHARLRSLVAHRATSGEPFLGHHRTAIMVASSPRFRISFTTVFAALCAAVGFRVQPSRGRQVVSSGVLGASLPFLDPDGCF